MSRRILFIATFIALFLAGFALVKSTQAAPKVIASNVKPFVRTIKRLKTVHLSSVPAGKDKGLQTPELSYANRGDQHRVNRSFTRSSNHAAPKFHPNNKQTTVHPFLSQNVSFDGLNHRQQRFANGGNQFSLEPPDQGLCVGNGKVMEIINDVVQVYDPSGTPLLNGGDAVDLNTFFGYSKAQVNRTTGIQGPFVTDPSCYYDKDTDRWYADELTLGVVGRTGAFTGGNHLSIAVSVTNNPIGDWVIYRLPVQDDGTNGTPDHHCALNDDGSGHGPCIGDYPHLGADANGIFITTNEYPFFPTTFQYHGAQIYALPKARLAANASRVKVVQFDTHGIVGGFDGFTIWPATSPAAVYETGQNGTEYFMSSDAAEEAGGLGYSEDLFVWAISNSASLNSTPALVLSGTIKQVLGYTFPPRADQKTGNNVLGQCLNNDACAHVLNGENDPFKDESEYALDSNDTRMQPVVLANGKLWGALDTGLDFGGVTKAGVEWFVVTPSISGSGVSATVTANDYAGLSNNNLLYPAIAVTTGGAGVVAFTAVGPDHFPSAAYASINTGGVGAIQTAEEGVGPADGFSGYKYYGIPPGTFRPRWGDYGAAVEYNGHIWIASEYIGQTCTLAEYETATLASPLFSCNKTRTALGNWDTRISDITP